MTKKEAIRNHRKMWNWIADETERQKRVVKKLEYVNTFLDENQPLKNNCYCCEYTHMLSAEVFDVDCEKCPIKWGQNTRRQCHICRAYCFDDKTTFSKWSEMVDKATLIPGYEEKYWPEIAKLAREIANLPEYNWY